MVSMYDTMRKELERTYVDTCDIAVAKKNTVNGVTRFGTAYLVQCQPCKLSYSNVKKDSKSGSAVNTEQLVKLFLSPSVDVPDGSVIEVMHMGEKLVFKNSGVPAIYRTHQEIVVEPQERWA